LLKFVLRFSGFAVSATGFVVEILAMTMIKKSWFQTIITHLKEPKRVTASPESQIAKKELCF